MLLCRKIYKPVFINEGAQTLIREINNDLALVDVKRADFGIDYYQNLEKYPITPEKRKLLEHKMFNYLKSLCYELSIRLPKSLNHFKKMRNLMILINSMTLEH